MTFVPHVLCLLNLGGGEVFLVVFVVLLLFGSKRIPELARGLGKGMREIKDATNSIQKEIEKGSKVIKDETKDIDNRLKD